MTPEREAIIKKAIADYKWFGSNSGWMIYQSPKIAKNAGACWLGVRTHGPAETEHDYVVQITKEEAKEIYETSWNRGYNFPYVSLNSIDWDLPDYPLPEEKKPSYDDITPGFWYLQSKYQNGWWIVKVEIENGTKIVAYFGDTLKSHIENFDIDQFIKKVPKPD